MKLITLKLENFQGIKSAAFSFGGMSASIYGDNATGKTTVYNALTWLLFDKASTGAKNFTPKTKGAQGDAHYLDHAVEAQFSNAGRSITLRKCYHENYKKKRGSSVEEFDGHGVDYYVDGVPTKEKDYQLTLLALGGSAEKMKMLTMPDYFPEQLPWDTRRAILLEVCGDINDDTVIANTPELQELPSVLAMPGNSGQRYTVDDYKKIAQTTKADINKQIQGIPGRIDEAQRAMPDTAGIDPVQIDRRVAELNARRGELEQEKARILAADTTTADIRRRIAEARAELANKRAAYLDSSTKANAAIQDRVRIMRDQERTASYNAETARAKVRQKLSELDRMKGLREQLLQEYAKVQQEHFDEAAEVCPTCGQRLPDDDVQRLREEYNIHKSQRLEGINARGGREASKDMIEAIKAEIAELTATAERESSEAEGLLAQIEKLRAGISSPVPFEDTEEYRTVSAQIASYSEGEQDAGSRATEAVRDVTARIQALYAEADAKSAKKALLRTAAGQKERIAELERREKELAARYEELERGVYLCELFIKSKVAMLTEHINEKFKTVRFRLFVDQLNGGIKEDCEVMIPAGDGRMVPFAFANNAARINAGLEIIDVLSRHWNLEMPVFVDNAESVVRIIPIDTQIIRLVVSEPDKALRLEVGA